MVNNLKIEVIESINILNSLAKIGSKSLPNELCRFLNDEFDFKSTAIAKEIDINSFKIIGQSSDSFNPVKQTNFQIKEYDEVLNSINYENNLIYECSLSTEKKPHNLQTILLVLTNKTKLILLFELKIKHTQSFTDQYLIISKFAQDILKSWTNSPGIIQQNIKVQTSDFLNKTIKGFIKEIKTLDGLSTLLKEEQLPKSVINYLDEIKSTNQSLLSSITDLSEIVNLKAEKSIINEAPLSVEDLLSNLKDKLNELDEGINISIENSVSEEIICNKDNIDLISSYAIEFIANVSKSKKIILELSLGNQDKIRFRLTTDSVHLNEDKLNTLVDPFENKELSKNQSGLLLTKLASHIYNLNGNLKFTENNSRLSMNISLPIKKTLSEPIITESLDDNMKHRILVIESDNASSSLLNNYLSKWNYKTDIVSSGNHALQLIKENRYVSVILNIEQENENSLELLQKIKNNKSTRNTPVIVFSVEAEEDKIYLMGSVDYLVKPINYNNLVEILTSYKLRRNSTVLCVDDDQPTLSLVKQAILTAGFNVVAEHRPEMVNDLVADIDLDLAIIDLDMPKLNGFDLIKLLKSQDKFSNLPIIIYTGKEDYQEDLQKIDGMFVDLLDKKSTSFNELENTILAMIKSYEEPNNEQLADNKVVGPKILMAEDYKHSQIIVTRLLKKSGFENIIVVENGEEALKICKNDKIDLVLMDMQMPVMNGFEATGKIRELEGYADTPIIALTAFAMKGDREKCLESGATDYIPKPIDSKEFIEKVKYYTQVSILN